MSILFNSRATGSPSKYQEIYSAGYDVPTSSSAGGGMKGALALTPVYAATALIADMVAAAPLAAFQKVNGISQRLTTQPEIVTNPSNDLDPYAWSYQGIVSVLLRGNAYGLIRDVDDHGTPSKVTWLHPDRVRVDETGSRPVFLYNDQPIARDSIIHVPGYVVPGSIVGLSPVGLHKLQIETGHEAQRASRRWYNRNGQPSGTLKNTKKTLSRDEAQKVKEQYNSSIREGDVFVTGMDWELNPVQLSYAEQQFLAGIKATANQIAAMYRVSPEDIGGETGGTSLTYKNLEQDVIRFNTRTLRPWTTRFEAALSPYLPNQQYLRWNLDASARADLKTRYEAHQIAITAGFSTIDEVRALEDRPPLTEKQKQEHKPPTPATPAVPPAPTADDEDEPDA